MLANAVHRGLLSNRVLLCVAGILLPTEATFAQTWDDNSLQEVIVTETKRPTKLADTPISMTVIGPDILKLINADSFADHTRLVPGLTAIDSGSRREAICASRTPVSGRTGGLPVLRRNSHQWFAGIESGHGSRSARLEAMGR
jgi:outer membrane receptor protein involved in Fe transport